MTIICKNVAEHFCINTTMASSFFAEDERFQPRVHGDDREELSFSADISFNPALQRLFVTPRFF